MLAEKTTLQRSYQTQFPTSLRLLRLAFAQIVFLSHETTLKRKPRRSFTPHSFRKPPEHHQRDAKYVELQQQATPRRLFQKTPTPVCDNVRSLVKWQSRKVAAEHMVWCSVDI